MTASSSAPHSASITQTASGWDVLDKIWDTESSSTASDEAEISTGSQTRPAEPQLTGAELREKLNEDLRKWQTKFAVAADKGVEDLEQRVADITKRQSENGINGHGAALVVQLEETAESTITKFKQFIKQTVEGLPADASEEVLEEAYEKCITKTRELGLAVKEKAQSVRTWKSNFEVETDSLVKAAVSSTVDVLDRIQSLGLQEIGMRWAWLEGVSYKDWKNYHKLRTTLNEWKEEVEAVGTSHQGLQTVHEEAKNLEDAAMAAAQKMVSELVRLKSVSKWKIWANDATDDFSDKKVPARAYKAATQVASDAQHAASQASEALVGSSKIPLSQSILEAPSSLASVVQSKATDASSKLVESLQGSETSSIASVSSDVSEAASQASAKVAEKLVNIKAQVEASTPDTKERAEANDQEKNEAEEEGPSASDVPRQSKMFAGAAAQVLAEAREIVFDDVLDDDESEPYSEKLQEVVSKAGDRASEVSKAVSQALLGSKTQGSVESATSLASEQYAKALAAASSALYGTEKDSLEKATSVASERFAQAVTA